MIVQKRRRILRRTRVATRRRMRLRVDTPGPRLGCESVRPREDTRVQGNTTVTRIAARTPKYNQRHHLNKCRLIICEAMRCTFITGITWLPRRNRSEHFPPMPPKSMAWTKPTPMQYVESERGRGMPCCWLILVLDRILSINSSADHVRR